MKQKQKIKNKKTLLAVTYLTFKDAKIEDYRIHEQKPTDISKYENIITTSRRIHTKRNNLNKAI
jgi:hypothetical protein